MFLIFYKFCKLEFLDTAVLLQIESFIFEIMWQQSAQITLQTYRSEIIKMITINSTISNN